MRRKKEKSLFRLWLEVQHERWMTRKALRNCAKLDWSVDFLTALLVRAANFSGRPYEMELRSPGGAAMIIRSAEADIAGRFRDDSIFNHLDNEVKVNEFINQVNRGIK